MPSRMRVFRVFVSSTFSDFQHEREALESCVFRRLEQFCLERGYRFQAVDLRWGISEAAARDQQTMQICLDEVTRCQMLSPRPNFLILLGDRYGWQPIPVEIPDVEFQRILHEGDNNSQQLLSQWYRQDLNAWTRNWFLVERYGEFLNDERWHDVENALRHLLVRAAGEGLPSATEHEILKGLFQSTGPDEHVFAFSRKLSGEPPENHPRLGRYIDLNELGKIDKDASLRSRQLRERVLQRLPKSSLQVEAHWTEDDISTDHLGAFCESVYGHLENVILEEISKLRGADLLTSEIAAHQEFARERAGDGLYVGREDLLDSIHAYLMNPSLNVQVVHGTGGSGKSALMARASFRITRSSPTTVVITRFVGATPTSQELRSLLESVCREIALHYNDTFTSAVSLRDTVAEFHRLISLATADRPLCLFLDALDQLFPGPEVSELRWLPRQLPPGVRVVISVLSGESEDSTFFGAARSRFGDAACLSLKPLSLFDGARLLRTWLRQSGRRLQRNQRRYVLQRFAVQGLPLYLKLACEQSRFWRSWEAANVGMTIEHSLSPDIDGIVNDYLTRLERDERHGRVLVGRTLGAIAAARHGLTEDELHRLLSTDSVVMADFRRRSPASPEVGQLPIIVWSRLYTDLEPYLTIRPADGVFVITFYHRQIEQAVRRRYLAEGSLLAFHGRLADLFIRKSSDLNHYRYSADNGEQSIDHRKLSELPFHLQSSRRWVDLANTMCSIDYLEAMVDGGRLLELQDDLRRIGQAVPEELAWGEVFQLVSDALQQDLHLLSLRPGMLRQSLWNRCAWHDGEHVASHFEFPPSGHRGFANGQRLSQVAETWLKVPFRSQEPVFWCRSLRPLTPRLGGGQGLILRGHTGPVESVQFSPDSSQLATGGQDGAVHLWEVRTGEQLLLLSASAGISCLAFSPDGESIVAGCMNGTIHLWNTVTGREVQKWTAGSGPVDTLAISHEGKLLLGGTDDGLLQVWQLPEGVLRWSYRCDGGRMARCAWSPISYQATWVSQGGIVSIYDFVDRRKILSARVGREARDLVYSANGATVAVVCDDTSVYRWEVATSRLTGFPGDRSLVSCATYHESTSSPLERGCYIGGGTAEGLIKVWDALSHRQLTESTAHQATIKAMCFSRDGNLLASGSTDTTVSLLNVATSITGNAAFLKGNSNIITSLAFSLQGDLLVSGAADGSVVVWEVASDGDSFGWKTQWQAFARNQVGGALSVHPSSGNGWKSWDALTGQQVGPSIRSSSTVTSVAFSHDDRWMACGGFGRCEVWDIASSRPAHSFAPRGGTVCSIAFLGDQRLACGMEDGAIEIWNPAAGLAAIRLVTSSSPVLLLAISPSNTMIYAVCADGSATLWQFEGNSWKPHIQKFADLPMDAREIQARHFQRTGMLPDPRYIAARWRVVGADSSFAVTDADSGRIVAFYPAPGRVLHRTDPRAWITHPSGRIWAGGFGTSVSVFRLECDVPRTALR